MVRTARILGLVPLGPLVRPVQVLVRDASGSSPSLVVLGSRLVAVPVSQIPVYNPNYSSNASLFDC